jgi:hypothetical protein
MIKLKKKWIIAILVTVILLAGHLVPIAHTKISEFGSNCNSTYFYRIILGQRSNYYRDIKIGGDNNGFSCELSLPKDTKLDNANNYYLYLW